jgi:hypothetical protein
MPLSTAQKNLIQGALDKGDFDTATKLIAKSKEDDEKAKAAAAKTEQPAGPRTPAAVILDLFKGVHSLLGNSPALVPLINELQQLLELPPTEAPPATNG